ncbi:MAG: antitoxin Xre-like helix-turn-helix domain-containing protein [Vulcanimicrobiaceae bacterium]
MTSSAIPAPDFTEKSERLSETALRTFFRIADHWGLSRSERRVLLGSIPESTFHKYVKSPASARLSRDTLERISHIVGIFKSINIILPRPEAADAWVKRPNSAALFKGRSALDYMMRGNFEDVVAVRRYLDDARGW